uniref:SDR family NAD(P)-dependent oxidoreductase n=1 Tax=Panagrellus redivivus TaxID=6233 RepID=A0A7E4V9Q3_PANRE
MVACHAIGPGTTKEATSQQPFHQKRLSFYFRHGRLAHHQTTETMQDPATMILDWLLWVVFAIGSFFKALYRNLLSTKLEDLTGKRIVITGAGGAIGRELSVALAKQGANLVLWDLFDPTATAALCADQKVEIATAAIDVTDRNAVYAAAQSLGYPVDILINNAGVLNPSGFLATPDDQMDKLIDVNVKSNFWTIKAFLPSMLTRAEGQIVGIASVAGLVGAPGLADYSASKFAVVGLMEALQHELAMLGREDITFTTICPIYVRTPMIKDFTGTANMPVLDVPSVVRSIVDAIRRKQRVRVIPGWIQWITVVKALFPWNFYQSVVLGQRFT